MKVRFFFLCMSDYFKGGNRMKLKPSILAFNNDFTVLCSALKQVQIKAAKNREVVR